ncbi:MAG: DUF4340 domain-containing protein [Anaerolineales bacterium]|nr:MAG: DUF4340 domain-containing protein [Anaerolineales bacterium]
MKRHNQILAGILVIQIILGIVVFWPKSAATGASEPLFPDMEVGDIVDLAIADADDNSVQLKKVSGDWVLPDADDYPAQADKITPLLDKMVGLTTGRLVTRTDASHKRLQVAPDDFMRRIDFETADGTKHTFYLGSSPRYGTTHFRVDGQSETYLTSELSTWETKADAASWVDTAYLSVSQDDVTKMTLENTNGTFTFTKDDEGTWTMDGLAADETLDENKVTSLIQRAASVNMTSPLGKEKKATYGMDEPNAVVTLETGDKTITLRVGAKEPDANRYVVISSESPYYVRVSEYSVKDLVEKTRDDFLQVPPTPTPEGDTNAS